MAVSDISRSAVAEKRLSLTLNGNVRYQRRLLYAGIGNVVVVVREMDVGRIKRMGVELPRV